MLVVVVVAGNLVEMVAQAAVEILGRITEALIVVVVVVVEPLVQVAQAVLA
jgi:hypothetical protein